MGLGVMMVGDSDDGPEEKQIIRDCSYNNQLSSIKDNITITIPPQAKVKLRRLTFLSIFQ